MVIHKKKSIQAIILAGGEGSRLRPYTTVIPKPLMPLGDLPIMEIVILQLKKYGFKNIVISTGYKFSLIETYFGDGRRWDVNIQYVHEKKPLGTAGALRLVPQLAEDVLVINGDVLTTLDFKRLVSFHKQSKAHATLAMTERVVKTDFGVIEFDKTNHLVNYLEKPEHKSFVSMGVNVFNRETQKVIKSGEKIHVPELMLRLKDNGKKVLCYKSKGLWLDLGRLDDFQAAQEVWIKHKSKFLKH